MKGRDVGGKQGTGPAHATGMTRTNHGTSQLRTNAEPGKDVGGPRMMDADDEHCVEMPDTPEAVCAVFALSVCVKLLLMPAYQSTDFEVHRNWMAITYNLPVKDWYFEHTSEWTLDYPPFFAWFEYVLSQFAVFFDGNMLVLSNLNYASENTVLYQRLTVIVSDVVLFIGVILHCSTWPIVTTTEMQYSKSKVIIVTTLVLFNPGLLMVDHIHFQYNGFLLGMLLTSVALIRRGDRKGDLAGAAIYAVLLMFKHLFMYIAPLYFVYLFRHYCFLPRLVSEIETEASQGTTNMDPDESTKEEENNEKSRIGGGLHQFESNRYMKPLSQLQIPPSVSKETFSIISFLTLGIIVGTVFAMALGPVILMHPDPRAAAVQLFSRLFPVQRGLCHAYWAPNFWALYNSVDKLVAMLSKFWLSEEEYSQLRSLASMTGGLVGETNHAVLPSIHPVVTVILTAIAMSPALQQVWHKPHPPMFLPALVYCMLCSFIFGYHVHEKAILMIIIPLTLACCDSTMDARLYLLLSWIAHVSLLPLLFTPELKALKPTLMVLHCVASYLALDRFHMNARKARRIRAEPNGGGVWLWIGDRVYFYGLALIYGLGEVVYPLLPVLGTYVHPKLGYFHERYPFLPLMLTSIYCGIGVIYCWVLAYKQLDRKVTVIESYQWSPRRSKRKTFDSKFAGLDLDVRPLDVDRYQDSDE